jgi:hypothetical protein
VTCKEEIINIAEYLKTKYPKDQFVYIVKITNALTHIRIQPLKKAAEVARELNQSNENSDTKRKTFST